jgi:hypothetical protein
MIKYRRLFVQDQSDRLSRQVPARAGGWAQEQGKFGYCKYICMDGGGTMPGGGRKQQQLGTHVAGWGGGATAPLWVSGKLPRLGPAKEHRWPAW